MPEIQPFAQPFQEAVDFFRQKVDMPTEAWTDLREGMHSRAFVVAGATKAELLSDFRGALQDAIEKGETLADFRKRFDEIVTRHGWSYNGSRGWRSAVIYDTNLRMAHSAGRWQQINTRAEQEAAKGRTLYIRYSAVLDGRTRPAHKRWHDIVLPHDDPFWRTHYPPNGWRCRCSVQILTERQLKRYGLKPTETPPDTTPTPRMVNTPAGQVAWPTPKGIDTGFGYNVGQAAFGQRLDEQTMAAWKAQGGQAWERLTPGDWKSAGRPAKLPMTKAEAPRVAGDVGADRRAFVEQLLGGKEKILTMPDGGRLSLTAQALADHVPADRLPYLTLLEETVTKPTEVWLAFERHQGTGKVRLVKRLIKAVQTDKGRYVVLTAQVSAGRFEAWTVVPTTKAGYVQQQRAGRLLWPVEDGS